MDSSLALTLLLSGLLSGLMAAASRPPEAGHGGPLRPKRLRTVQVLGFDWKNCGQPDAPAVLRTLALTPDPISIPGDLTAAASGTTAVELAAPLSLNVTLEKEVAGFWVRVPCVEELGSCHYGDACAVLSQLTPPGQDCPEPLHSYGLPCRCPFKAGSYSLPQSQFYLPHVDLPYWLTNGNYRVQGVLGGRAQELGCLRVALSLRSS
ncbi:ganglioside GM2 activator [Menidia menidia]